ncbi:MAG: hypothetical protein U0166_08425 [Acidobacteriota bacterium]
MRSTRLLAPILAILLLAAGRDSAACSCHPPPPPDEALKEAAAVFVGKVVKVEPTKGAEKDGITAVLEVSKAWKGIETARVSVATNAHGSLCGFGFVVGTEYMVYADGKSAAELSTSACTRSRPAAEADDDLRALGEPVKTFP